jgi:hypothetical protein
MSALASSDSPIRSRRAIEALRSGVPNRDAVATLGCDQTDIEEAFQRLLEATADGSSGQTQAPGILVSGGFGSGKSHLLEYLMHLAVENRFVCSKIVISKETPLFDPAKLYRAALRGAAVPNRKGAALTEIAANLDFSSERYADFYRWVHDPEADLNSRFPATVFLYEREKDPEVLNRIISFWSGDPLGVAPVLTLRGWLRAHREAGSYRLERVAAKDLWIQRFRFLSRLITAAGYRGWVLLVDEVELIGRYSFKQRARSYAELARWAGALQGEAFPGLATVFAITSDFSSSVLAARNDTETVPGRLRASLLESDHLLASQAERGMRLIDREALRLKPLTSEAIDEAQTKIRELHARAYGWAPPPLPPEERLTSTLMRQYVRRWINEWDLKRLYPEHDVHMVVEELGMSYSEDRELERAAEDDTPDPGD